MKWIAVAGSHSTPSAATIDRVIEDPLKAALQEIAPKLDPGLDPLATALLAEEPVEDAWAGLLQEVLDAA